MTTETLRREDFRRMVDGGNGTVDRRIFSDQAVYEAELEQIFARAWNFMAHESQVPNAGDFFLNYIGEDRVIVVRDKEGGVQVLLNTCRHRGNAVCRAEEGHATSFMCTYHGWTYDLHGRLVGVPGFKDYYHEDLNREEWGLVSAAKVDSYHGFIFATLDPDAAPLDEYLGDVGRLGLNLLAARGDLKIVGGIQKYVINCNWKLAADNSWDWYHPSISHASAFMSGAFRRHPLAPAPQDGVVAPRPTPGGNPNQMQMVILGEYGHAISGPLMTEEQAKLSGYPGALDPWRSAPETHRLLGEVGMNTRGYPGIFPNCWVATNQNQVCLRLPKGPAKTEIWWFTLIDAGLSPEVHEYQVSAASHTFGPAGRLEQEDGENWGQSTIGTMGTVSRRFPLNFNMNHGHAVVIEDETGPPHIETNINEHAQLWLYRSWAEWMAAESWSDLRSNHSPAPSGAV